VSVLIVCDRPASFELDLPDVEVVAARDYLTDPRFSTLRHTKVFNLCRSYRYQTVGYYVSLLGEARGHRPLPSIAIIQDLRLQSVIRVASESLEDHIQPALRQLRSDTFDLSVYFGRNLSERYARLSLALFNQFPAPFLRARFARHEDGWELASVRLIGTNDIPDAHRPFVVEQARRYFARRPAARTRRPPRWDLAILQDPHEPMPPSNQGAIRKFAAAAEGLGFGVELIDRDDYGRIGEFDALFIRETTWVNHHTFRFARRATADGLVVIDDPDSILKCTNKVYLTELLQRHRLATPRTVIVAKETAGLIAEKIGFPCVIKKPDSAFSSGVMKYESEQELDDALPALFESSDLLLAQEYVPTAFDWRVTTIDGAPLFVCKYHMARRHWQIVDHSNGGVSEGEVETLAVEEAPADIVSLGVRAARLIGRGLYGVDIKELRNRPVVIEINDNPNVDAGYEDRVLGRELYARIMRVFRNRLENRGYEYA
jgi:glutathione synthase/RimK-type ligase-like ATP-grasp enzyme